MTTTGRLLGGSGIWHAVEVGTTDLVRLMCSGRIVRKERLMARGDGLTACKFCGSGDLWANFFDVEGFGSDGYGPTDKWDVLCQSCGKFQIRRNVIRKADR